MSFICDTWLSEDDLLRLWEVCEGIRPQGAATYKELIEFIRVVNLAAMFKVAGEDITDKILN